ncbi:MAG: sulfatase-like hydrolase/transferase [Acidobacteria bacterium]|nr:sulfatase-like hydrolase/transferase [Acidobacteriota bacterium]
MRFPGYFLTILLLFTWPPSADTRRVSSAPPNIVLITLDTTRADRMGFLGSSRGLTPNLDTLARQAVVFSWAYSHVPLTTASHSTILTGTYPQFNHVVDFGIPLNGNLPYLPDILRHQGYRTAAFVGSLILDPLAGTAPGFDRGFEVYDAGFHLRRHGMDRYQSVERRAGVVVDHALGWLNQNHTAPFFVWVHLYDAHDPYDPPAPFKQRYASQPYDGEIAYADAAVGKLLSALRRHALYDGALIAVMADHGESLGAHGENTHGVFLYDETLHVPLVLKLPRQKAAGRRVEARVGLVDVAPTILREVGVSIPHQMQGEPLQALFTAAASKLATRDTFAERPAYAETDYPHRAFGWSGLRALRTGKYLYIQAPQPELYNRVSDPGETHNIVGGSQAVAHTLASELAEFRTKTSQTVVELARASAEEAEKLAALGYVASGYGAAAQDQKLLTGADPKTKIEVSNLLHDAMFDVEDARYQQALPLLKRVLQEQPEMPVANMQYGMAQARLGNYSEALGPLKKAVQLVPDNGMGHYELGLALFETGDWKAAAPEFEAAVTRAPRWTDAHFSLAAVYARIDRVPEAMKQLDVALAADPDHYRANLLRGRLLSLEDSPEAGLANLQKAAQIQPTSVEAHLFLADAYAQLGRQVDAQAERAEAYRLKNSER